MEDALDDNEDDSEDETQEDVPEEAAENELDNAEDESEDEGPSDLDLVESGELSTNGLSTEGEEGASPSIGEDDAEGTDESGIATDGEGDE